MSDDGVMAPVPAVLVVLAAYVALFVVAELLRSRRGWGAETTRRLIHSVGALIAVPLPLLLGRRLGVVLAVGLAVLLVLSTRYRPLASLHDVRRSTVGEVVFPLGIALAALVATEYGQYVLGVLVLGLADPAAGVVGARYGTPLRRWPVSKSLVGSATFLAVTVLVALAFWLRLDLADLPLVLASALLVTGVEVSLGRGLDNLAVPGATALAFGWMF